MRRALLALLLLLASSAFAAPPKLVVVISIDQFPSSYLDRYANVLGDGGFKRLAGEGTSFINCAYPYSTTFTGPGHASIGTGHAPSESGIVGNNWYDHLTFAKTYCVQDDVVGSSPLNLAAAGLGDRLQES